TIAPGRASGPRNPHRTSKPGPPEGPAPPCGLRRRRRRISTLFPYTTLFRSESHYSAQDVAGRRRSGTRSCQMDDRNAFVAERVRSEEHTSELQSPYDLVCRLLLEKKKRNTRSAARHQKKPDSQHTTPREMRP